MKSEIEWLKNFKENLEVDIHRIDSKERRKLIIWELSWVNKRLEEIM